MKKEKSNKNKDIRPGYWRKAENERIYAQDEVYISDSDSGEMVLAPQMFWPVYEFEYEKFSYEEKYRLLIKDQDFFPKFDEYCQSINCVRNFSENMNPENIYIRTSFLDSLCKAEIVYIVDKFFSETEYEWEILIKRLREQAFLNAGLNIILKDEREGKENGRY